MLTLLQVVPLPWCGGGRAWERRREQLQQSRVPSPAAR